MAAFYPGYVTEFQFQRGKINLIMDEPLREMYADPEDARDPPSISEEIERAIVDKGRPQLAAS